MNMHAEHRRRVKNRFLNEGLDHFEELHALELLLFSLEQLELRLHLFLLLLHHIHYH